MVFARDFWERISNYFTTKDKHTPMVVDQDDHGIDLLEVSANAVMVLKCLQKAGHAAFLVGGGVRDLMLDRTPKDFDISTDAHPEAIHTLFKNSRIIGKRFRLVHIFFREEIIEVSTFRAAVGADFDLTHTDNKFGSLEEDAWRRDFTVNALYLNTQDGKVLDFTGGLLDLESRMLKVIGDPSQRFHEDPVRILRAIRLAAKLKFSIEKSCEDAIVSLGHLLNRVPTSRIFDEVVKLFFSGYAQVTFERLCDYDCFEVLFPFTAEALEGSSLEWDVRLFLGQAMYATDYRIQNKLGINPGFLLAVLLWPVLSYRLINLSEESASQRFMIRRVVETLLKDQRKHVMMPRRFTRMIREIWFLQYHMNNLQARKVFRIAQHRYFGAAVDFLELRVVAGEPLDAEGKWWRAFREADKEERLAMKRELQESKR